MGRAEEGRRGNGRGNPAMAERTEDESQGEKKMDLVGDLD